MLAIFLEVICEQKLMLLFKQYLLLKASYAVVNLNTIKIQQQKTVNKMNVIFELISIIHKLL